MEIIGKNEIWLPSEWKIWIPPEWINFEWIFQMGKKIFFFTNRICA